MSSARAKAPPRLTETQVHLQVAAYNRKVGLGGGALMFHIRGERAGASQRMAATRAGVMAGLPDWAVVNNGRAGFIELKPQGWRDRRAKNDKYTRHELRQLAVQRQLVEAGCWIAICESFEEVLHALMEHQVRILKWP